ncbi:MAG: hypothetical protein H0X34_09870 [Chthoniobacterales bacterium]|nr:hypothetical protein [Chthoniobacterales bacterium]
MSLRLGTFFLLLLATTASGQLDQLQGLNGLQDVPLTGLSQPDNNPLGAVALALHPEDWKHAEGEHFIYHYVRSFVATRISVEAEFNFRVVAQVLEKEAPASERKSHIYIFDRPGDWREFQKAGELEPWSGGIQSAGSLFLLSDPSYKFSGNTVCHEIAHLLLYRYYGSHIPCWLNEGFAEYVSRNSRASYQRARGYLAKPHSSSLAPEELIPLDQLTAMIRPPNEQVDIFYDESERLVRFLAQADQTRFLALLQVMAGGEEFEHALLRVYAGTFASRSDFEEKFHSYASRDL